MKKNTFIESWFYTKSFLIDYDEDSLFNKIVSSLKKYSKNWILYSRLINLQSFDEKFVFKSSFIFDNYLFKNFSTTKLQHKPIWNKEVELKFLPYKNFRIYFLEKLCSRYSRSSNNIDEKKINKIDNFINKLMTYSKPLLENINKELEQKKFVWIENIKKFISSKTQQFEEKVKKLINNKKILEKLKNIFFLWLSNWLIIKDYWDYWDNEKINKIKTSLKTQWRSIFQIRTKDAIIRINSEEIIERKIPESYEILLATSLWRIFVNSILEDEFLYKKLTRKKLRLKGFIFNKNELNKTINIFLKELKIYNGFLKTDFKFLGLIPVFVKIIQQNFKKVAVIEIQNFNNLEERKRIEEYIEGYKKLLHKKNINNILLPYYLTHKNILYEVNK
jgi:hypothetical protein